MGWILVKRLAALVAVLGAAVAAARTWRSRRADAELWQEATRDLP